MITPTAITDAAARIAPHIRQTPILWAEGFGPTPVALKLEQTQHTGSFKVRGAFNALLSAPSPVIGVVAFSGGNHGAAVAYAATKLGVRSKIFVPAYAGDVKIGRMRGFGAEVVLGGDDPFEVLEQFTAYATQTGARPLHPYDDALVLTGQGTLAREFAAQTGGLDTVIVSIGGGGLIGGISAWFGSSVKVVGVETTGTTTYATALRDGVDARIKASGLAASSLGAPNIGRLAFDLLARGNTVSVTVDDAAVRAAQRQLWADCRIVGEPGAATALAALTSGAYVPQKDERVGVVICGGNAEPGWFLD